MINGVVETVGELVEQLKKCSSSDKIKVTDGWNMFIDDMERGVTTIKVVRSN